MGCAAISSCGIGLELARQDQLLLVAPGQRADGHVDAPRAHVEQLHQPGGQLLDLLDEQDADAVGELRVVVTSQDRRSPRSSCRGRAPARGGPRGCSRRPRCGRPSPTSRRSSSAVQQDLGRRRARAARSASRPARAGRCPRRRPPPGSPRHGRRTRARAASRNPRGRRRAGPARRSRPAGFSRRNSTGRPTIISASFAFDVSAGVVSPTTAPRRSTVMRSAICRTSSSLWLMNTIVLPASRSLRRLSNRSCVSIGREDRRRLVQDQDLDAAVERLQDLDALLLADGELLDHGVRAARGTRRCPRAPAPGARHRRVSRIASTLVAQDDVLGDGERVHQHEVLVDHADAQGDRVARRRDLHLLAADRDPAAIGRIHPVQHPHQRGLPRAVLADQRVHLARDGAPMRHRRSRAHPGTASMMCSSTTRGGALPRPAPCSFVMRSSAFRIRPWSGPRGRRCRPR